MVKGAGAIASGRPHARKSSSTRRALLRTAVFGTAGVACATMIAPTAGIAQQAGDVEREAAEQAHPSTSKRQLYLLEADFDPVVNAHLQWLKARVRTALRTKPRTRYRSLRVEGGAVKFNVLRRGEAARAKVSLESLVDGLILERPDDGDWTVSPRTEDISALREAAFGAVLTGLRWRLLQVFGPDGGSRLERVAMGNRFVLQIPCTPGLDVSRIVRGPIHLLARLVFRSLVTVYTAESLNAQPEDHSDNVLRSQDSRDPRRFVVGPVLIGNSSFLDARVAFADDGAVQVQLDLRDPVRWPGPSLPSGQVAIVLGGEVVATPRITGLAGTTKSLLLEGNLSLDSAQRLVNWVRSHTPPMPLRVVREWSVDEDLGPAEILAR